MDALMDEERDELVKDWLVTRTCDETEYLQMENDEEQRQLYNSNEEEDATSIAGSANSNYFGSSVGGNAGSRNSSGCPSSTREKLVRICPGFLMSPRPFPNLDYECDTVGLALQETFTKLMNEYPLGLSRDKFLTAFKSAHGYVPKFANYGYFSVDHLISELPTIFKVVKESPLGDTLLFPINAKVSYKNEDSIDLDKLFVDIWTVIKGLLKSNGYILELRNVGRLLTKELGYHADPSDWCYGNELKYYEYCLENNFDGAQRFLDHTIEDPSIAILVESNPNQSARAIPYQRRWEERIRKEQQAKKEKVLRDPYDHRLKARGFVKLDDKIEQVADEIQAGGYYKCLGGSVNSPGHFYVNLGGYWKSLEDLMANMQKTYQKLEDFGSLNCAIPWKGHLRPGYYVAVKRILDGEYHRAQILEVLSENTFKVIFIDYGDIVEADVSKIRYLYLEFFKSMKAQKVRCVAQLGQNYNRTVEPKCAFNKGLGWTDEEGHIFRKLIFDKHIAVHFKTKVELEGETAWEVVVHILKKGENRVEMHHVEREVLKISHGSYAKSKEEESENKKLLPCKVFNGREFL